MGSRPTRSEIQERRRQAVALFERECAPTKVARELGISRSTAYYWHRAWRQQGAMGLELAPRRGRPRNVSEEQLRRVRDALIEGPPAHGFRTWTLATIAELIHRMAGVRYHPGHVWRVLRRMGWRMPTAPRRGLGDAVPLMFVVDPDGNRICLIPSR